MKNHEAAKIISQVKNHLLIGTAITFDPIERVMAFEQALELLRATSDDHLVLGSGYEVACIDGKGWGYRRNRTTPWTIGYRDMHEAIEAADRENGLTVSDLQQ
jgi:hypothetical protein